MSGITLKIQAPAAPGAGGLTAAQVRAYCDVQEKLADLKEEQRGVHEELYLLEKQIYHLETNYLEDTQYFGNVLKGWDGLLNGRQKQNTNQKPRKIRDSERMFSHSSTTAPKNIEPEQHSRHTHLRLDTSTLSGAFDAGTGGETTTAASTTVAAAGGGGLSRNLKRRKKPNRKKVRANKRNVSAARRGDDDTTGDIDV